MKKKNRTKLFQRDFNLRDNDRFNNENIFSVTQFLSDLWIFRISEDESIITLPLATWCKKILIFSK